MNADAMIDQLRPVPRERMDDALLAMLATQERATGRTMSVFELPGNGAIFIVAHTGDAPSRDALRRAVAKHVGGGAA